MDTKKFNDKLYEGFERFCLPSNQNATIEEIDYCIAKLNEAFNTTINSGCIPKKKIEKRGPIDLPQSIIDVIKEKKRLRRMAARCVDPQRKNSILRVVKNMSKTIEDSIYKFEDEYWSKYLEKIKMNNKTYRKIKALCGLNRKANLPDLTLNLAEARDLEHTGVNNNNNIILQKNSEKINALALSFEKIHSQGLNRGNTIFSNHVKNAISSLKNNNNPIIEFDEIFSADGESQRLAPINSTCVNFYKQLITADDIGASLHKKNNKKSFGEDGVSNFLLRKTDRRLWKYLAILFNQCYNIGYFPRIWKRAMVIAVPKPGTDAKFIKNYRPISMLSNISKLFEEFLSKKITEHCELKSILKKEQFGFRSKHSTNHALTILVDFVSENLNKRQGSLAVGLDSEKAFDTAWIEGIVFKMKIKYGLSNEICRIIYSYLTERTFFVCNQNEKSNVHNIEAGVPQGSLLGPILYNLLLADIPSPQADQNIILLIYADDILIVSSDRRMKMAEKVTNEYLEKLAEFFHNWKIKVNPSKSECTVFKGVKKYLYPNARKFKPVIILNNEIITYGQEIKYLGVILHSKFTFIRHIDYILFKAKKMFFSYANLFKNAKDLKRNIKLNIYKQIIRPILAYAFPVWFNISSCQMERIRTFERYILRLCSGINRQPIRVGNNTYYKRYSNDYLYSNCQLERIDCYLIKSALNFIGNMQYINNEYIQNYIIQENEITAPITKKYLSPIYIKALNDLGYLHINNKLLYYHRRYKTYNTHNNLVYNTAQY